MAGWRGVVRALHRDLGYLCLGLTLIYAVSGILLNHLHDWNSFYRFEKTTRAITPVITEEPLAEGKVAAILTELGETENPLSTFQPDAATIRVFFEKRMIDVDLRQGLAVGETVKERALLAAINALHLNQAGPAWTWLTDVYAGVLAFLALSSLFMVRGPRGIRGRGGLLTAAGILLPLVLALVFL